MRQVFRMLFWLGCFKLSLILFYIYTYAFWNNFSQVSLPTLGRGIINRDIEEDFSSLVSFCFF